MTAGAGRRRARSGRRDWEASEARHSSRGGPRRRAEGGGETNNASRVGAEAGLPKRRRCFSSDEAGARFLDVRPQLSPTDLLSSQKQPPPCEDERPSPVAG